MIEFYSTNYFAYEPPRRQAIPIKVLTDETHPFTLTDERFDIPWLPELERRSNMHGRASAGYWKYRPELVFPDTITGFISGNVEVRDPSFAQRCLDELGDDDILLMRHPYRDDIVLVESASHPDARFDGQDTAGQVQSYLDDGYPQQWGLFFAGLIIRRDTPEIRAFDEAVNAEVRRWSGQDQLILPYLIWKLAPKWHAWPDVGRWHAQPFEEGWLHYADIGRELAA